MILAITKTFMSYRVGNISCIPVNAINLTVIIQQLLN